MYTNNAYLNNSTIDRKDKSKELLITMCGTYKLYTKQKLPTWRPRGRLVSITFYRIWKSPLPLLIMIQMKPSFMLVIWYYTDLRTSKI